MVKNNSKIIIYCQKYKKKIFDHEYIELRLKLLFQSGQKRSLRKIDDVRDGYDVVQLQKPDVEVISIKVFNVVTACFKRAWLNVYKLHSLITLSVKFIFEPTLYSIIFRILMAPTACFRPLFIGVVVWGIDGWGRMKIKACEDNIQEVH